MYARATLAQLQPGKVDELLQFLHDNVVPAAKAQQGFKGLLLLTDETTNKGIAIALWETEADMAASEAADGYYTKQLARGAHFFAAPPVREAYQVTLQV
ncbi:MAG: antibiotic biosynthesis monooxygenase family protein [Ktedonobacteraceae bacterium]